MRCCCWVLPARLLQLLLELLLLVLRVLHTALLARWLGMLGLGCCHC
jgi:hypothetical protein